MVVIERQQVDGPTWATFTAVLAGDGRTARGTLVNRGGNYGLMFMVRREFLSDFKHLLTEEGRQAEAQRRLIGIENLEAVRYPVREMVKRVVTSEPFMQR